MAHIAMIDLEVVAKESVANIKESGVFRPSTPKHVYDKLEAQILKDLVDSSPETLQLSLARDSSVEVLNVFKKAMGK